MKGPRVHAVSLNDSTWSIRIERYVKGHSGRRSFKQTQVLGILQLAIVPREAGPKYPARALPTATETHVNVYG